MQRDRGQGEDSMGFRDPFSGFPGLGRSGSLMSRFYGGRDSFDDPFFTRPFDSMFGPSMLRSRSSIFEEFGNPQVLDQQPARCNTSQGPIIQEISSDDDDNDDDEDRDKKGNRNLGKGNGTNSRQHPRSGKAPYVQDPDEIAEENKKNQIQYKNDHNKASKSKARAYSFQSSTVTYGGINGAYYTSSTTRRGGRDGVMVEESKEADTTTGRATHRISRGIRDKGHSFTRKLSSGGKVETMQTLHNLNEDELAGFEEAWKRNAGGQLPGWDSGPSSRASDRTGGRDAHRAALPSTEQASVGNPNADSRRRRNIVIEVTEPSRANNSGN